jgi:type I restriction enzyme S subunit
LKAVRELCVIKTGKKDVNQGNPNGQYPFFTCSRTHTYSDSYSFDTEALLIAGNGEVGLVQYFHGKFEAYQRTYVLSDFINVQSQYLFQFLKAYLVEHLSTLKQDGTISYIKLGMLADFMVPIPPFELQNEFISVFEKFGNLELALESEIASRKSQYEYYRNKLLNFKELELK